MNRRVLSRRYALGAATKTTHVDYDHDQEDHSGRSDIVEDLMMQAQRPTLNEADFTIAKAPWADLSDSSARVYESL